MAAGDSLWGSVVLAMHMDDAGLTDATGKTVTLVNTVARSGDRYAPLTGNAYSALFASGSYLSLAQNSAFNMTGDFTVEAWIYPTTSVAYAHIVGLQEYGHASWMLNLESLIPRIKANISGTNSELMASGPALTINTWSHVAAVRSGNNWTVYTNGVAGTTGTYTRTLFTSTKGPTIGLDGSLSYPFSGNLDDLRVTKGVARYTSNFAPPTTPFLTTFPSEEINSALVLPALTSESFSGALLGVVLSPITVNIGVGAIPAISLPSLSAYATAHDSTGDRAADITLPSLTVAIRTGANATVSLPKLSSVATGTVTNLADAGLSLPSLTTAASVTVAGMANAAISLHSMSASSYAGALCSVTLGEVTLQASGTANGVGSAQVTLPLFQATAIATAQNRGGLNIVLPSLGLRSGGNGARASLPSLQLTAIGTAVIAVSYEAYAVNLGHLPRVTNQEMPVDEVTHYTNFPFTHVVRYKGSYYGANSTGLYLLEGTTDSGTPIPFAVKTCETDFDKPEHKTVESVYFAGRIGNAETVTLFAREETTHVQTFTTPRNTKPQSHRQMFARGLKSRYFALGLSGSKEFELDTIDLSVGTTKRRI